ncbi:MAG TPA: hypothetical protein VFF52_28275, partial [Isosphaeraceae bacterium]|nr:hypothetical protein [Isosphaeraceae bacterium]
MSTKLRQALEQVAQRFRRVRLWSGLALCWLALALIGSLIAFLRSSPVLVGIPPGWLLVTLVSLATVAGLVCTLWALRSARDPRWVARRIEVKHPELAAELLAAVDEVEAAPAGRLSFLQASVVREALEHRRSHDWDQTVPTWMIRGAKLAHAAALALLLVVVVALTAQVRSSAYGGWGFWSRADAAEVQIDPGDTEIERGSTLLVVARFQGTAPPDARLVVEGRANGPLRRAMTRSLEDPTFAGRVESVESDLAYRVEFEGRSTETYHVHVFEYPELNRADAHLIFPKYTALEPKVVEDIRHVTAVEGTELT